MTYGLETKLAHSILITESHN